MLLPFILFPYIYINYVFNIFNLLLQLTPILEDQILLAMLMIVRIKIFLRMIPGFSQNVPFRTPPSPVLPETQISPETQILPRVCPRIHLLGPPPFLPETQILPGIRS